MRLKNIHYAWVIVVLGASLLGTHALVLFTRGVFLPPLTVEFDWTRGAVSGAYSAGLVVSGILALVSGRMCDRYGPRVIVTLLGLLTATGLLLMSQVSSLWQFYLIWMIFMGVGGSCAFPPITATVAKWFTRKRRLAIALIFSGFGIGSVAWPPVTEWLISVYDWRRTYLIMAIITFAIIVLLAQFMKHSPHRAGLKPYGEGENNNDASYSDSGVAGLSLSQAIRTRGFWLVGSIQFGFFFALQLLTVHIYPYAVDVGVSTMVAAGVLSVMAGSGIVGRLIIGFISDKVGDRMVFLVCLISVTLTYVWLLFARDAWSFFLFAAIFGLAWGGIGVSQTVITAELFGVRFLGSIIGSFELFLTIGGAVGALSAGAIYDLTGEYNIAFLISIAFGIMTIILALVLYRYKSVVTRVI